MKKKNKTKSILPSVIRDLLEALILTLWPFAPHIAEENGIVAEFSQNPKKHGPYIMRELTQTDEDIDRTPGQW